MQKFWIKFVFVSLLILSFMHSSGQEKLLADIAFVENATLKQDTSQSKKRAYLYSSEDEMAKKINPINMAFGAMLYVYQNTLSQQFSATCLYHPSCSDFSKQCIHEYGLLKGMFLSADRVSRCNRIAATGIHPLRIEKNKVLDPASFYKSAK